MGSASGTSVLSLDRGVKNFGDESSDLKNIQKEIKEDIEESFKEYNEIQESYIERFENFENSYNEEIKNVRELFTNMGKELDRFKNQIKQFINTQVKIETQGLNKIHLELSNRIDQMEQIISTFGSDTSTDNVQEVRDELIEGIRLIGKRVTKVVQDLDRRFNDFTEQIEKNMILEKGEGRGEASQLKEKESVEKAPDSEFGNLKESDLLSVDDYEIVPKNAIGRLTLLFKKQSQAMKKFIEDQQDKIKEFERMLKNYELENAKLLEMLEIKTKRNLRFSIFGIAVLFILVLVFRFIW